MQKIILYKKHKMQNSLSKIKHIKLRDIIRVELKILRISSKKKPNKQNKNLVKLSKIFNKENKTSNNMLAKN